MREIEISRGVKIESDRSYTRPDGNATFTTDTSPHRDSNFVVCVLEASSLMKA